MSRAWLGALLPGLRRVGGRRGGHRALDQLSYRTRISVERLAEIERGQIDNNYSKPTRRRELHGAVYGGLRSR